MRAEFTGSYCLGKFPWMAVFLSFLASWLCEISIYHRKNPSQKQKSGGTMGQDDFSGTVLYEKEMFLTVTWHLVFFRYKLLHIGRINDEQQHISKHYLSKNTFFRWRCSCFFVCGFVSFSRTAVSHPLWPWARRFAGERCCSREVQSWAVYPSWGSKRRKFFPKKLLSAVQFPSCSPPVRTTCFQDPSGKVLPCWYLAQQCWAPSKE